MYCSANQIYQKLINAGIKTKTGKITIEYLGVKADLDSKDAVGHLLQEWLGEWFKANQIYALPNPHTQKSPDFFLNPNSDKSDLLEVKSFNYDADPAFDVADFESYWESLQTKAYILDTDYLIFGYSLSNYTLQVKDLWLKKIWEITGSSSKYPVKCQYSNSNQTIKKIRPITWHKKLNSRSTPPFSSRRDFVYALHQTLLKYKQNNSQIVNWFQTVDNNYSKHTGQPL
jgi:type II restriction enzyme